MKTKNFHNNDFNDCSSSWEFAFSPADDLFKDPSFLMDDSRGRCFELVLRFFNFPYYRYFEYMTCGAMSTFINSLTSKQKDNTYLCYYFAPSTDTYHIVTVSDDFEVFGHYPTLRQFNLDISRLNVAHILIGGDGGASINRTINLASRQNGEPQTPMSSARLYRFYQKRYKRCFNIDKYKFLNQGPCFYRVLNCFPDQVYINSVYREVNHVQLVWEPGFSIIPIQDFLRYYIRYYFAGRVARDNQIRRCQKQCHNNDGRKCTVQHKNAPSKIKDLKKKGPRKLHMGLKKAQEVEKKQIHHCIRHMAICDHCTKKKLIPESDEYKNDDDVKNMNYYITLIEDHQTDYEDGNLNQKENEEYESNLNHLRDLNARVIDKFGLEDSGSDDDSVIFVMPSEEQLKSSSSGVPSSNISSNKNKKKKMSKAAGKKKSKINNNNQKLKDGIDKWGSGARTNSFGWESDVDHMGFNSTTSNDVFPSESIAESSTSIIVPTVDFVPQKEVVYRPSIIRRCGYNVIMRLGQQKLEKIQILNNWIVKYNKALRYKDHLKLKQFEELMNKENKSDDERELYNNIMAENAEHKKIISAKQIELENVIRQAELSKLQLQREKEDREQYYQKQLEQQNANKKAQLEAELEAKKNAEVQYFNQLKREFEEKLKTELELKDKYANELKQKLEEELRQKDEFAKIHSEKRMHEFNIAMLDHQNKLAIEKEKRDREDADNRELERQKRECSKIWEYLNKVWPGYDDNFLFDEKNPDGSNRFVYNKTLARFQGEVHRADEEVKKRDEEHKYIKQKNEEYWQKYKNGIEIEVWSYKILDGTFPFEQDAILTVDLIKEVKDIHEEITREIKESAISKSLGHRVSGGFMFFVSSSYGFSTTTSWTEGRDIIYTDTKNNSSLMKTVMSFSGRQHQYSDHRLFIFNKQIIKISGGEALQYNGEDFMNVRDKDGNFNKYFLYNHGKSCLKIFSDDLKSFTFTNPPKPLRFNSFKSELDTHKSNYMVLNNNRFITQNF